MGELLLYVLAGVSSRLLPHPANVTAIGALAVFTGARRGTAQGTVAVLAAMLLSDIVLGFHPLMWATYGSLFLAVCIGRTFSKSRKAGAVAGSVVGSATLFYLVTNFAVWQQGLLYPHTAQGLAACYLAGLPFFRNSLIGDLGYASVLFLGEAAAARGVFRGMRMRRAAL